MKFETENSLSACFSQHNFTGLAICYHTNNEWSPYWAYSEYNEKNESNKAIQL